MIIAMAAFSMEDMFVKAAAETVSLGIVLALFGLGGMIVFIVLTRQRGEKVFHTAILSRPILLRAVFEIIGRLCFTLAFVLTPLSSASAILQAMPLVVVVGAAYLFKEHVGLDRWIAVLIGFIGVLIIIRPGLDSFELASLFAVIGTLGFAGRDLATRAAPKVLSNIQLGVYGFFVLIPTGLTLFFFSGDSATLNFNSSLQIFAAILFGVAAYYSLTVAMRTGDVSVVSPFRYSRLLFAMVLGVFIFGERPDAMTLLGSIIIVLSGGYTLLRSRNNSKQLRISS